ncbi:MAG: FAD binding domain-containing protein [Rhodospirillaceae bacterium]
MYDFTYARPASVADAKTALAAAGDDGIFLAGGQSLLPALKLRLRHPATVVDLGGLPGLDGISIEGDRLVVGALATHAAVAESKLVRDKLPALAALAAGIGDPQVRNRGTLGGSIANADPAADYPAAVVGLDAEVVTDRRSIKADAFFTGLFETALEAGEIVTAVKFRIPEKAAYVKFPQPASHFALVGVMAAKFKGGARVAVTGAGPSVFRVEAMEKALTKDFSAAALGGITVPADDLNSDMHADAAYRAHLVGVMAKRAVA